MAASPLFRRVPSWLKSHDLSLPPWGPYSKTYAGISHRAQEADGLRFDVSFIPGFYRRRVDLPSVLWECGWQPIEARPDLGRWVNRHHLIEGGLAYADVTYLRIDDDRSRVSVRMVNRTEDPQSLVLHATTQLVPPFVRGGSREVLRGAKAVLPSSAELIHALDYEDLVVAKPGAMDRLTYDGWLRGEFRDHGFLHGSGLALTGPDDKVSYRIHRAASKGSLLVVRLRNKAGAKELRLEGPAPSARPLRATDDFQEIDFVLEKDLPAESIFHLSTREGGRVEVVACVVVPSTDRSALRFEERTFDVEGTRLPAPDDKSLLLRFADAPSAYALAWDAEDFEVRRIRNGELDSFLRYKAHDHVNETLHGDGLAFFNDLFVRPIALAPGQTRVFEFLVANGDENFLRDAIRAWRSHPASEPAVVAAPSCHPAGLPFLEGRDRMAATLYTNVVYPIYTQGSNIVHSTPGRWWDCLYTWDSGFIGLGFTALDRTRAEENLLAYLMDAANPHASHLHHGSTVPVQAFLFQQILNLGASVAFVRRAYPMLRKYWLFYAGLESASRFARQKSGLLSPWEYFYNSGGWDDYPPQFHVHKKGLTGTVTPVITTAMAIRFAKILEDVAGEIGEEADRARYAREAARLTEVLQRHAWDEKAGVFSYVVHDEKGEAVDVLRHESGENFNRGGDGVVPLVAGAATPAQRKRLLDLIFSETGMWTPHGITTVSRDATYYRKDGYWNGTVWFPHQWFLFKAMLDLGEAEKARRIAITALELWSREVKRSGLTFEHFVNETGRGAGWHHFGGLSAPIVQWFASYFEPGTLTTGFDANVRDLEVAKDRRSLRARLLLRTEAGRAPSVVFCLPPGKAQALWDGKPLVVIPEGESAWSVRLPEGDASGVLEARLV